MRKIILMLLSVLYLNSNAQNSLWLEQGENTLIIFEFKDFKENVFNYIYTESEFKNNKTPSTYILASRDQKWWDKNIWIHGEFRTFVGDKFLTDNIYLIGPMFEIVGGKIGFINIQTMYRYDGKSNFQVTALSDVEYKKLFYSMYIDMYGTDNFYFHTENRLFIKLVNHVRIGGNVIATLNEEKKGLKIKPMFIIRIDL